MKAVLTPMSREADINEQKGSSLALKTRGISEVQDFHQ